LLTASGIANEMIVTDEWGLTDENANILANRLRVLSQQHEKIILVSASKGGLETAVALGKIMKPEETKSIKAWISVGGVLKGSPVADTYLCWPKCWIAEIGLWTKGKRINLIQDVSYKKRTEDFKQLQFPENIKIIHFIGAPLATQINKEIKSLYCSIIHLGPNDGLTPLADELTEKGIVITELGLDHHYRSPNIDKKTIALALVVAKIDN
jgi:triacylglycerol esterase/lipase EstA (alpha/beta hydrolase family)